MPHTCDDVEPALQDQLEFLGFLTPEQRLCLPDWLVVAPPKTGTSWVYANLRMHPDAFAADLKELKYFSNRFELEDLRNYVAHFRSGVGKVKGEASPSYSLLPCRTIRLIRKLIPDVKLIYLMREPIGRAWSHARHNFREKEATFKGFAGRLEDVSDDKWIECVRDDWNRLSGDYLGQLQRWLSVFPRRQVYLGFFEDIARNPRGLLREVLQFLGLDPAFADSEGVVLERVNAGLLGDLSPRVESQLAAIWAERTRELAEFLHEECDISPPDEWERALAPAIESSEMDSTARVRPSNCSRSQGVDALAWHADDDGLAKLLTADDLLERDFLGYHIIRRGKSFAAYPMSLGILNPDYLGPQWWIEHLAAGQCIVAANPYDLKSMIVRKCLARDAPPGSQNVRLRQLEQQLDRVEDCQASLKSSLSQVTEGLQELEEARTVQHELAAESGQSHIVERVNLLKGQQAQFAQDLVSVRLEHRQLADEFQALDQRHRELVEFSRSLRKSCEELVRCRDELLQSRDEIIESRDALARSLDQSNGRLQEAEVEVLELKGRIVALESSLLFRALRRLDSWMLSLRLPKRRAVSDEATLASIVVPSSRAVPTSDKAARQTNVAENVQF